MGNNYSKESNYFNQKITSLFTFVYILMTMISFCNFGIFSLYCKIYSYVCLPIIVIIFCCNFNKILKENIIIIPIVGVIFLFEIISLLFTEGSIGSVVSNISCLMGIIAFSSIEFNNLKIKKIFVLFLILSIIGICFAPNCFDKFAINTYNFNPNTIGQILMYCLIYVNLLGKKINVRKSLLIIYSAVIMYFVFLTQSRGSIITSLAFLTFIYLIPSKILKSNIIFKCIYSIVILIGILIPLVYSNLYKNNVNFEIPIINKPLYTGRETLWTELIYRMNTNKEGWIFGIGSNQTIDYMKNFNTHNMYFAITINFGIPVLILFYFVIILKLNKCDLTDEFKRNATYGFICVLINGFFETSMLWEAMHCFAFILIAFATKHEIKLNNVREVKEIEQI